MRKEASSWLSGPAAAGSGPEQRWRGERLGLPRSGPGSLAPLGRRVGALAIDWLLAYVLVLCLVVPAGPGAFGGRMVGDVASWLVPLLWWVIGTLCVTLFAQTPGQALTGTGTARIDADARVGLWRAALRTALILVVLPALIQDEDGRGMHDRATGTAIIRTR